VTSHVSSTKSSKNEHKQPNKAVEPLPKVVLSSSAKTNTRSAFDSSSEAYDPDAYDPRSESNRGGKRKDGYIDSPSPSLTLAQGLSPMLNGDALRPFSQQNVAWDDLWLEQDDGNDLRVFVNGLRNKLVTDAGKQAVSLCCISYIKDTFSSSLETTGPACATSMVPTLSPKGLRVRAWFALCTLRTFARLLSTPSKQTSTCPKKNDDDESTDSKDSGSSPRYTSGGEEDEANTPSPPPHRLKQRVPRRERRCLLKNH
jgi:hypothetical protein